jgi:hypothetical protein
MDGNWMARYLSCWHHGTNQYEYSAIPDGSEFSQDEYMSG